MKCQTCKKAAVVQEGFCCAGCVRAALYPLRIERAKVLLDKADLGKQVEEVLSQGAIRPSVNEKLSEPAWSLRQRLNHEALDDSKQKAGRITTQAERLQEEIIAYQEPMAARKDALNRRRAEIKASGSALSALQEQHLDKLRQASIKSNRLLKDQQPEITSRRIRLCQSAAFWARLRRTRKPWSGNGNDNKSFEYSIGGHIIPDLRELNNLDKVYDPLSFPANLTAVLTDICRLLHIVCRYLQIRLPAEVTAPHRNWPLPTIFSPTSSYSGGHASFPFTSPSSSRHSREQLDGQWATGRPRPLFLTRPVADLMRDETTTYALFIEGVTLLAWDVAWLCRTQGLPIASSKWEDVCAIGHNLWLLLVDTPRKARAPLFNRRVASTKDVDRSLVQSPDSAITLDAPDGASPTLGQYSHGSLHNFLKPGTFPFTDNDGSASRGWLFASPVKIQHELKSFLLNEQVGQGWEFPDGEETGVLLDGHLDPQSHSQHNGGVKTDGNSVLTKVKGTSGWTKLKSRMTENE